MYICPCTSHVVIYASVRVVYHAAQNAKMKLFALVSVVDRLVLHSLLYALVSSLGGRLTPLVGAISCVVDVVSRLSIRSMTFKCYQLDKRNYFIDLRMLLVEKWRRDEHLAWHNRLHLELGESPRTQRSVRFCVSGGARANRLRVTLAVIYRSGLCSVCTLKFKKPIFVLSAELFIYREYERACNLRRGLKNAHSCSA
ncbi:hypothetical protein Tco_1353673 [Tanacetum coccineum]